MIALSQEYIWYSILAMENIHVFVKQVGMQREVLWPNYYFLSDSRQHYEIHFYVSHLIS